MPTGNDVGIVGIVGRRRRSIGTGIVRAETGYIASVCIAGVKRSKCGIDATAILTNKLTFSITGV